MARKVIKKTVKKSAKPPETEREENDVDELFEEVKQEVEQEERDEEETSEEDEEEETAERKGKKKPSLFSRGAPAPILKIPAGAAAEAAVYGNTKLEMVAREIEEQGHEIIEKYAVREPFSYAIIYVDKDTKQIIYHAVEPELMGAEKDIFDFVVKTLSKLMRYDPKIVSNQKILQRYLERKVEEIIKDLEIKLPPGGKERLMYFLLRDYIGYNKFQILMDDDHLEDLSCDGVNVPLFVYHRQYEQIKTNIKFEHAADLDGFVVSLAQRCGRYISVADPILDATMPDGSRVNMTYGSEITTRGSTISIRKFNANPLTITDLIKFGTLDTMMGAHLWMAVQYQESMLFVGGSASGKTATMNAAAMFIPWESKIISIEDTREVNIPQENWLPGVTRETGGRGGQDITMYTLLRAALRQRPEYLLVGEVRGEETMTMFQAMATGHTTYSTMHGESAEDVIHRLENKPINVPRVLLEALNLLVVHTNAKMRGKKVRRIKEMKEILEYVPTTREIKSNTVFQWIPSTDSFKYEGHSKLIEKVAERENTTEEEVIKEMERRAEVLQWMVDNNINYYKTVTRIVQDYYSDITNRFSDNNKVYKAIKEGRGDMYIGNDEL